MKKNPRTKAWNTIDWKTAQPLGKKVFFFNAVSEVVFLIRKMGPRTIARSNINGDICDKPS
jgi:hypothetical protein